MMQPSALGSSRDLGSFPKLGDALRGHAVHLLRRESLRPAGYHVDDTKGVAKGNEPESIYAVMSGTHFNGQCCFDYGNSENTRLQPVRRTGGAHMHAVCTYERS